MTHIRKIDEMIGSSSNVVTIKSIYSDDGDSLDGIYRVEIPAEFKSNYKQVISGIGGILNDLKNDEIETLDDVTFEAYTVDMELVGKVWDKIVEFKGEGTSLGYLLEILGWEYENVSRYAETFDADYSTFE